MSGRHAARASLFGVWILVASVACAENPATVVLESQVQTGVAKPVVKTSQGTRVEGAKKVTRPRTPDEVYASLIQRSVDLKETYRNHGGDPVVIQRCVRYAMHDLKELRAMYAEAKPGSALYEGRFESNVRRTDKVKVQVKSTDSEARQQRSGQQKKKPVTSDGRDREDVTDDTLLGVDPDELKRRIRQSLAGLRAPLVVSRCDVALKLITEIDRQVVSKDYTAKTIRQPVADFHAAVLNISTKPKCKKDDKDGPAVEDGKEKPADPRRLLGSESAPPR